MKAEELMIGDWVYKMESDHLIPVKVLCIYDDGIDCQYKSCPRSSINMSAIEPIPFTLEIFEKNHLDNIWEIYYELGCNLYVEGKFLWCRNPVYNNMDFHYVHEIQHLLRSFKIEREIVL